MSPNNDDLTTAAQVQRRRIAAASGYKPKPVPVTPVWALGRIEHPATDRAAEAALRLRGLSTEAA